MSNILRLKEALNHDVARGNQFRIIINPPALLGISLPEVDRVSILAKSVTTPEDNIGVIEVGTAGKKVKFRGDREYTDLSIDIRYDAILKTHDFLYSWMDFLVGHNTFNAARSHNDYTGSMIIEKLRLYDSRTPNAEPEVVKRCFVSQVFPTNISGMPLDQDETNNSIIISTTWAYTDFNWV